jgi:hypothetical protein
MSIEWAGWVLAACGLLLPGAALLWPLLLFKWLAQKAPPVA